MNVFLKLNGYNFFPIDENYFSSMTSGKILYEKIEPIITHDSIDQNQIMDLIDRFRFIAHDEVNIKINDPNFSKNHTHPDVEGRWTIGGSGSFFLPFGKTLIKIQVEKGDFVIIKENVNHWYEFEPENSHYHSVVRFFQNNERITDFTE